MRLSKFFWVSLSFLSFFIFAQHAYADLGGKQEDPDMDALRKWIQQKRMVTVKEIGGDLSISGEVRVEMQATNEKKDGVKQRGRGGGNHTTFFCF